MKDIFDYIIYFLLGKDTSDTVNTIGYTADEELYNQYRLVIHPCGFFDASTYGKPHSMPSLPLQEVEGVPLLFGEPQTKWVNHTLIIYADIIASSYFLLTRYEEIINRNLRDEHGRFPGKFSLPYRAGFIHRPIVDEYGILLKKWLTEAGVNSISRSKGISKIYITHDVDAPFLYRSWKGLIRSYLDKRGLSNSSKGVFGDKNRDPFYTFPWLFSQKKKLEKLGKNKQSAIIFFRTGGTCKQDKPHYQLKDKDISSLLNESKQNGFQIGLHASYDAGIHPELIKKEKQLLEDYLGEQILHNRNHFLASREPEDMDYLTKAGIKEDFTMGYADVAGFRLGTSRAVKWINPQTKSLTDLILHPLTIMDCTLEDKKYMNLTRESAWNYVVGLVETISNVGGEITLLWHNTSVREDKDSYLRVLYSNLLNKITEE